MRKLLTGIVLLVCAMAAGAQTTQITASHIAKFGGAAITGQFCVTPTDGSGNPINLITSTGQQFAPSVPLCFPIVNGVLSNFAVVPDTNLAQPQNACMKLIVYDNHNSQVGTYPCLQPSGSTWSFDAYVPSSMPSIPALTLPQFQTAGVANGNQGVLNLKPGANITLTPSGGDVTIAATGGGTPGGSDTQIQFNSGGTAFGGDPSLTFNHTTKAFGAKIINGIGFSNNYPGSTLDARYNACVVDAETLANGNTTGICDASGETGTQITVSKLITGDTSGDAYKVILPAFAQWRGSMTDGVSPTWLQYGGGSVIGASPMSGVFADMVIGATSGSNLGYVCEFLTSGSNQYIYDDGFNCVNQNAGRFTGHATATGVGSFVNGPFFDNSIFDHVGFSDGLDTSDLVISDVCCNFTLNQVNINGLNGSIPLTVSGSLNFTATNSNISHPSTGHPMILIADGSGSHTSTYNFSNIYSETNATDANTCMYQVQGAGAAHFSKINFRAEKSGDGSPGICSTNAANTMITADGISFTNGSGDFFGARTAVADSFTGQNAVSDSTNNYGHFVSNKIMASNLVATNLATQFTVGTGGVTANTIVSFDSSGHAIASSGTGFGGLAASTVSSGGTVEVVRAGTGTCIFDAAAVVGDIAVPSTTTPGECHDSGVTSTSLVLPTVAIVGPIETAASGSGVTGTIRLHGPGSFGLGFPAYLASPPAIGGTAPAAGTFTTLRAASVTNSGLSAANIRWNYCFGDSTMVGITGSTVYQNGLCGRLGQDLPGITDNRGISSTFMNQIVDQEVFYTVPATPLNGSLPPLILMNGGINDANTSTSTGAEAIYTDSLTAGISFETNYANLIFASAATKTGTWTADTTDVPLNAAVTGTAEKATTSGATLTFSVPAGGAGIGVIWEALTSGTGTFTLSIDGTNQTSACSGSTSFTNSSCSSVFPNAASLLGEVFSASVGTHTVVITTATAGQSVIPLAVFPIPTSTVGQPLIMMSGVIYQNADANSAATAAYNTLASTVVSTLAAENMNVLFVDMRGGTPGINSSTDMSATSGIGGSSPLHPNDAGYLHETQTWENTAPVNTFFPGISPYPANSGVTYLNPRAIAPSATVASPVLNFYGVSGANYAQVGLGWSVLKSQFVDSFISSFPMAYLHCTAATPMLYSGCTTPFYVDSSGNESILGTMNATTFIGTTETVSSSATPTFSLATKSSRMVLTTNVTTFTLASGTDGQEKCLNFVQGSGSYTVTPPSNVLGFFTPGTVNGKRNQQCYTYFAADSDWEAQSAGVINQ